jgi:hypothetical protein
MIKHATGAMLPTFLGTGNGDVIASDLILVNFQPEEAVAVITIPIERYSFMSKVVTKCDHFSIELLLIMQVKKS